LRSGKAIPQKFLELILWSLKQGGFVESHRGAEGGYSLARRPDSIAVGQVLRFVDGSPTKQKGLTQPCPFSELWHNIDKSIAGIADRTNFASIIRDWEAKRSTYGHDFEI
jgi:Rrf2 family protein